MPSIRLPQLARILLILLICTTMVACGGRTCRDACTLEYDTCNATDGDATVDGDAAEEAAKTREKTIDECVDTCMENKYPTGCLVCAEEPTCSEIADCYSTNPRCESSGG